METRAHTQGIWLRSRDQLKESALSFENKRRDAYSRTKELARIYYRKWKALAEQNKKKKRKTYNARSKRRGLQRAANENTKTKERETHSSAKEIGLCLLCEMEGMGNK